jgi:single-stranded DNA-binding protein
MPHAVVISGILIEEPILRRLKDDRALCTLIVESDDPFRTDRDNKTRFVVSTWGKLAVRCGNDLARGDPLFVVGNLISNSDGHPAVVEGDGTGPRSRFRVHAQRVGP